MPNHVVQRVGEGLNLQGKAVRDSRILVVGVAYKRDVEDVRESPALTIIRLLEQRLAWVTYHDPFVPLLKSRHLDRTMESVAFTAEQVRDCDVAVIVTDHSSLDYRMLLDNAPLVVDTRNATADYRRPHHNVILA